MGSNPQGGFRLSGLSFRIRIRGSILSVSYQNQGGTSRTFAVNGETREGVHDRLMDLDRMWIPYLELESGDFDVEVVDGPYSRPGEAAGRCI